MNEVALRANDVLRNDVGLRPMMLRFAREDAEHITSLCDEGAIHHYGEAITSLRRSRYITLYKQSNL